MNTHLGVICSTCGVLEYVNADHYGRELPLLKPTTAEVRNFHRTGNCGAIDPPGVDYQLPANLGR